MNEEESLMDLLQVNGLDRVERMVNLASTRTWCDDDVAPSFAITDIARRLLARVRALEAGLRDLEWRTVMFDGRTLSNYRLCHQCNRYEQNGHAADCPLAALLARAALAGES